MKINDSNPQMVDLRRTQGAGDVGRAQEARATVKAAETTAPAAAAVPMPAASIQVASSAVALHAASQDAEPLSDTKLLDQIKERIERGEMEFDYSKIANALIDDAVAAAGSKSRGSNHG